MCPATNLNQIGGEIPLVYTIQLEARQSHLLWVFYCLYSSTVYPSSKAVVGGKAREKVCGHDIVCPSGVIAKIYYGKQRVLNPSQDHKTSICKSPPSSKRAAGGLNQGLVVGVVQ